MGGSIYKYMAAIDSLCRCQNVHPFFSLQRLTKNRREEYVNIFNFTEHYPCKQYASQNTEISPNFLVWKTFGNTQFPQSFGTTCFNLRVFTKCLAKKLGEVAIFYAVFIVRYDILCFINVINRLPK